ncbi:hypothetical protein EGW08_005116 [Elysia chlorotica]|uniref:Uncharacterized protein n=1 Tax=Elysia chlorotica TaxID=188477 RepID=A0A433TZW2_ELYCH|nr:hypothetical protein EGW08_005116 [Elysia chlorotica]
METIGQGIPNGAPYHEQVMAVTGLISYRKAPWSSGVMMSSVIVTAKPVQILLDTVMPIPSMGNSRGPPTAASHWCGTRDERLATVQGLPSLDTTAEAIGSVQGFPGGHGQALLIDPRLRSWFVGFSMSRHQLGFIVDGSQEYHLTILLTAKTKTGQVYQDFFLSRSHDTDPGSGEQGGQMVLLLEMLLKPYLTWQPMLGLLRGGDIHFV